MQLSPTMTVETALAELQTARGKGWDDFVVKCSEVATKIDTSSCLLNLEVKTSREVSSSFSMEKR